LVTLFVDPNDYKDDIERLAEQQTGRQLILDGDLKLSLFPWIAIEFGPASLGDAPGFGDQPFLALKQARLGIRFWPLLGGKVEIGAIRLDGVSVHLITDAQGRNNWDDLSGSAAPGEARPATETDSLSTASLAGLDIVGGSVSYEDRRDNSRTTVRDIKLATGAIASGKPFDVSSGFVYEQAEGLEVRAEFTASVTADLEASRYGINAAGIKATLLGKDYPQGGLPVSLTFASAALDVANKQHVLTDLKIDLAWRGEGLPAEGVPVALRVASLQADLAKQTLALTGLDVDAAGAKVTGQLAGKEIVDAPQLAGQLTLASISLRDWLPKVGIAIPVTRDPAVLKRFEFTADVALTAKSAELGNLSMKLDDTTVKGTLGLADFDTQAVRFTLDVDRIDADRYLAPEKPATKADSAPAEPVEIPVDTLRKLNARGTINVGEAVLSGIKFSKLRLGLDAHDGDVRVKPMDATVYGGQYRGNLGVAARNNTARVTLEQQMTNVDFAPLFKELFDTTRLSGKGSFASRLAANGRDTAALQRTLGGSLDFAVSDGALEGADLWYEIRRARALLKRQAIPARTGPERTDFTALKGSATVTDGVVTSNDLVMAMQYLRVAGKATVDLPKNTIDSRLEATVLRIPAEGTDTAGMEELVNARIPVRITGPIASPKALPDIEGLIKEQVKEKVKEKIRDTIQDRLRRALGGQ
ncbi:MAG: AsmA family protein, partial [Steroidobacteraceae bacterium]